MLRASASLLQLTSIYSNDIQNAAHLPYAYFLELDDVQLLLDCGWDEEFSEKYLEKLLPYAEKADAVLLSSPNIKACGALPFVLEHLKSSARVFSAPSTSKIGLHGLLHPFLYQYTNTHDFTVGNDGFTLTVDKIYSAFRTVREPFGGKVLLSGKSSPVECFTHFSSRMLGGFAWTIKYQIDEIFYCPDYSSRVSSYSFLKPFCISSSPNILLIESFSAEKKDLNSQKRKFDDQLLELFREIQLTLRSGSDVLIPVDIAGRGIEILHLIVNLLRENGGENYKVVLASLQGQEVIDKAKTMTESFRDGDNLSDLFSSVIVCKNASDVIDNPDKPELNGPKICIADGSSMNCGVAGDLLSYFLERNADGAENLIVIPEQPLEGSNAFKILTSEFNDVISYDIVRRCSLNREELEEYYLQIERDIEAQKTGLANAAIDVDNLDSTDESMDEEEDSAERADSNEGAALGEPANAGLFTTHSFKPFKTKHLQFVVPVSRPTLQQNQQYHNFSYGIPINEEEESMIRKLGASKKISDEGPEILTLTNDAQMEANLPSKILRKSFSVKRECRTVFSDLSGYPDSASSLRALLKNKFPFTRKIVCLRGSLDNYQDILKYCRTEKGMKCGENVFFAQQDVPVKLDTPIFSYTVKLGRTLEQRLPGTLKRVRDNSSNGDWEVGWVDGCLFDPSKRNDNIDETSDVNQPLLNTVPEDRIEGCAAHRHREDLDRGSFFVGNIDLWRIKDTTKDPTSQKLNSNLKAPLLLYDDGVCVRRSADGSVTIASLPTPSLFDVRRSVYDNFFQVL